MSKPRLGASKRAGIGLLAGALALFGVALAPSAGATATVTTTRLAGATRYGTAAAIAGDATFASPKTAIVATGENYPDALAASTLAGANAATPIILTQTNTYTSDAKSALGALKGKGVTAVTLVGGTNAVSDSVKNAIAADGFTVTRVAGVDRYATAAAIATQANSTSPALTVNGVKTALIATGLNFPDALAGGPAAYAYKLPLLLVNDTVPDATKNALQSLGVKNVQILGGTAAVSDAVKAQLDTITGGTSARLAGVNRYGTAAAVGDYEISTLKFGATAAVLATGLNFPDALAAGPLGGQNQAPIVLTASLPDESKAFLQSHSTTIGKLYVSGGTAAIDDATVAAAVAAAQGGTTTANGVTSRPELVSSAIQSTDATNGSVVRYCYDESINAAGATPGAFHVYNSTGHVGAAPGAFADTGTNKAVVPGSNNCVDIMMPNIKTAAAADALSLAAADVAAATGSGGAPTDTSTAGSAPLGTGGTGSVSANTTSAPDLVSVGNFRSDPFTPADELVDFTFDQAAYVFGAATGFHLVKTDGTTDTPSTSVSSGSGTTVITARYVGGAATINAGNTARGYVVAGTVQSTATGGTANPLEAAKVSGTSNSPDLLSATLNSAATCGAAQCDQITFTFDKTVTLTDATKFAAILASGATVAPTAFSGTTATVNPSNQSQVAVNFADASLNTAVGGIAGAGAVMQFGGSGNGNLNKNDEVGMTNGTSQTVTPGKTDDPDLLAATVVATKDAFGNITGATIAYTFDENLTNGSAPAVAKIMAYDATGTAYTCTLAPAISNTAPNRQDTAVCALWDIGGGPGGGLTVTQAKSIVLGTVGDSAVTAADNGNGNTEGAKATAQFGFA